jgi:glycosyltransferase involved in cell wall biosynthesis
MTDLDPLAPSLHGRHVLILNWRDGNHPEAGGSEVYVENMARGMVERGAAVTMIGPRYPGAPRRERIDGIEHRRYGGRLSIYLMVPLLALFRRLPRHDVVVEIQNGMPFLASAYLRGPVVVLVHHVHREQWSILFSPRVARFGWWLESKVAPAVGHASTYITVSDATRRELVDLGVDDDRITVIRNGSPERGDLVETARSARPSIVVLGRLVPHKRVEIAIDAVATLSGEFPDLELTIVGEGWWHTHLVDHVRRLALTDRVVFTGHVSDDEKHAHLSRAWVGAVPSLKEGWGLVIVEAGLHQTPTVAFRSAGGVQESILDGETGLLVDEVPGFARAIGSLLRDDALRDQLGVMAEKHARSFTWDASQEAFGRLVAGLIR